MKSATKMSAEDRKQSIIQAVRKVFADNGFRGVTSRELARAAGISEALLFRHFPSKDALYAAIQESCYRQEDLAKMKKLDGLENSTSNLVLLIHLLVSEMFRAPSDDEEEAIFRRLFLRSITEDGAFVRLFLKGMPAQWVKKTALCFEAAVAAGDAVAGPSPLHLQVQVWFTHHLAAMIAIHLLPEPHIVDYGISRRKLIEQTVWFALRGLGLKDKAIRRHFDPARLQHL